MIKTALLALAVTCAVPTIAHAGDAGCVWRALPESARAQALKTYEKSGPEDVFQGIDDETLGGAVVACVALPRSERAAIKKSEDVGIAVAAYVIQLGSEAALKSRLKVEPTALERAYGGIDPKRRNELMNVGSTNKPSKAIVDAVLTAIESAYPDADIEKLIDTPDFEQFVLYFSARAMRDIYEAKF